MRMVWWKTDNATRVAQRFGVNKKRNKPSVFKQIHRYLLKSHIRVWIGLVGFMAFPVCKRTAEVAFCLLPNIRSWKFCLVSFLRMISVRKGEKIKGTQCLYRIAKAKLCWLFLGFWVFFCFCSLVCSLFCFLFLYGLCGCVAFVFWVFGVDFFIFIFYNFYFILEGNKAQQLCPCSELSILSVASCVRFSAAVHLAQHPKLWGFSTRCCRWLNLAEAGRVMESGGVPSSAVVTWWPCSCTFPITSVSLLATQTLWGEDFPSQCGSAQQEPSPSWEHQCHCRLTMKLQIKAISPLLSWKSGFSGQGYTANNHLKIQDNIYSMERI